jgi:hypothetical protein
MRRIKLGAYPVISLSDARQRAQGILRDMLSANTPRAFLSGGRRTLARYDWRGEQERHLAFV